ncbi:MAG: DUF1080 domain-containing protein [Planctomycetaceae bacterium]|jgi:hypothetical protein|nr:LamG domain-containing protein [bacterium]MDG2390556.1 DUF1080 domain-containing protein [Planctomycetaceae bacterium]
MSRLMLVAVLLSLCLSSANAASPDEYKARGHLIFEDDFERDESTPGKEEIGNGWTSNSPWRAKGNQQVDLVDGAMKVTRHKVADHGVAIFQKLDFQDAAVELRFKLGQGDSLGLDFVDREVKTIHAGHLCMARVALNKMTMMDSKTGHMDNKIRDRRQAGEKSPELTKLINSKKKDVILDLAPNSWHTLLVVVEGPMMATYLDGKLVGEFESVGIAHPTKRMITLAVGKKATVDDVKVWKLK